MEHPVADAVALASVAGIFDEAECRVFGGEGLNDVGSIVAGAVVDDDNLGVPALSANVGENLLQSSANTGPLVVSRNDDAVCRIQFVLSSQRCFRCWEVRFGCSKSPATPFYSP